jgi:hypothetical protein
MTPVLYVSLFAAILGVANVPTTYRVVVLDCSGSMDGAETNGSKTSRRIDIAVDEIHELARQLPPSPANPLGLVLFNDQAHSHEFTDLASFEAALNRIAPNGGTAVSPGLKEAYALLTRVRQSTSMFVLLYTDGENGEADGDRLVAEQEAALDRLFASRHQRGLATHVICRRWANANNDWIKALKQKPHWGVVDAEDFALRSVTAAPGLDVLSARWLDDQALEVTLRGHAHVSDTNSDIDELTIRCVNGVTPGMNSVTLPSDDSQATSFLVAAKAANLEINAGRGQLRFQVQTLPPRQSGKEVLVPAINSEVRVAFAVPQRERVLTVHGELKPLASRWTNPRLRQVVTDVELTLDVRTVNGNQHPWSTTIDFVIEPAKAVFLVSGSPLLRVTADGKVTRRITLARELAAGLAEGELAVRLVAQNAPRSFTLRPPSVDVRATFTRPAPAETEVVATSGPPVRGQWIDVGRELAAFEFPLNVVVRGPTTDSSFTIVSPPNVFGIDFEPSTLRSGAQTILVRLEARCDAHTQSTIQLDIVPPPATDVVQYTVAGPLNVQIIGPPPLELVLVDGERLANGLRIEIPDTMDTYEDALTTALLGAEDVVMASGLKANITSTANLPFTISSSSRIGEVVPYTFRVPPDHNQNFWLGSHYEVEIQIEPDRPLKSIVGSKAVLQLVVPAPFMRWLFGVLVSVGAIALIVGPLFALCRVRRDDDFAAPDAEYARYG